MRIMGIDPSMSGTGLSLPDGSTLVIRPRGKGDDRLREIADHIHVVAQASRAELVVMEGLFGVYKGEAARVVPMVHGAIRLELLRLPVPYVVLNPTSLKRFATGKPSANKTDMALAALKRLGREYGTDDECDADWLRVAGRFAYGLPEVTDTPGPSLAVDRILTMPQEQIKALRWSIGKKEEIVWPVVGNHVPWPQVSVRA